MENTCEIKGSFFVLCLDQLFSEHILGTAYVYLSAPIHMFSEIAVPRLWLGLSWLDLLCYFEFSQIWSLFLFWAFSGKWYYLCTWNPFTFSAAHGGTAQSRHCFGMTSSKSQDTRPWRYLVNSSRLSRRCSSRHFPAAGQEVVFSNGDLNSQIQMP